MRRRAFHRLEGYARDIVRMIQDLRKQKQCRFTDRIRVYVLTEDSELLVAIRENMEYIIGETLADEIAFKANKGGDMHPCDLGGKPVQIDIETL
jgi:Domain of unknown function (DUF5915)